MDNDKATIVVRINELVSVNLELKKEMSIAEFLSATELLAKLDKYSWSMKRTVQELQSADNKTPKKQKRMKRIDGEALIKDYDSAKTIEERTALLSKYPYKSYHHLQKAVSYHKKKLMGGNDE